MKVPTIRSRSSHCNLESLCDAKRINPHQAWWPLFFYRFCFCHVSSGFKNTNTDALSHLHSTDSPVSAPESILLTICSTFVCHYSHPVDPGWTKNPSHRHRNCMFMSNCGTNSWTPCISLWALGIQGYTNPLPRLCHVQSPLQPFSWKAPSTAHSSSSIVTSRCGLHDQPSSLSSQTCILMAVDCFSKTPHLVSLKGFYQQLFRL